MDVDSSGAAYVTGGIQTTTPPFDDNAFVAKVLPSGAGLAWMTVFGGSANDQALDIDVDMAGNSYVTGATASSDFPVAVGPDTSYNGYIEGFLTKLSADGSSLIYSGYVGGSGLDFCERVVVDAQGFAYLHGPTSSIETTFPITVGPDKTCNGGSDVDGGHGVALAPSGALLVVGHAQSNEATAPVVGVGARVDTGCVHAITQRTFDLGGAHAPGLQD